MGILGTIAAGLGAVVLVEGTLCTVIAAALLKTLSAKNAGNR